MVIPGAVWSAIFIVLSMLPAWLQDSFSGADWLVPITGAILIVLKVWEVYKPSGTPDTNPLNFESASVSHEASKTKKFLLG
jgi:predicted small integral membrane protein